MPLLQQRRKLDEGAQAAPRGQQGVPQAQKLLSYAYQHRVSSRRGWCGTVGARGILCIHKIARRPIRVSSTAGGRNAAVIGGVPPQDTVATAIAEQPHGALVLVARAGLIKRGAVAHQRRRLLDDLRAGFFFGLRSGSDVKFAARVLPRASDSLISPRPARANNLRDCAFDATGV